MELPNSDVFNFANTLYVGLRLLTLTMLRTTLPILHK